MTEVGLQKGVRDQAGRIGGMVDTRLLAQGVEALFKKLFRLRVLPGALIGACQVDTKSAVLFAEISGLGLRLMNGAGFLEAEIATS